MKISNIVLDGWRELVILAIIGTVSFLLMKDVALTGDEWSYARSASALVDFIRSQLSVSEFSRGFVSNGYFMPGISLALTPIVAFDLEGFAFVYAARAWVAFINLTMVFLILLELKKRLASRYLSWLFLLMFFSPYALMYISTLWADLLGCLIAIYITLRFFSVIRWNLRKAVWFGLGLALMVYFRGNYLLLLPIFFVSEVFKTERYAEQRVRNLAYVGGSLVFCLLLLLPWSTIVNKITDISTLTTTSLKMSQIIGFGETEYKNTLIAEGGGGHVFTAINRAVRQRAEEQKNSVGVQYVIERDRALAETTTEQLFTQVSENIRRYLEKPSVFPERFIRKSCERSGILCSLSNWSGGHFQKADTVISYGIMMLLALFMILPIKAVRSPELAVFAKGLVFLYLLHPLVAYAHSRYLVQFVPLLALIGCLFIETKRNGMRSLIGFDRFSLLGAIGNLGQLLALLTIGCFAYILLVY